MGAAKVLGTKEITGRFALGFKLADVGTWFRTVAHDFPSDQPQEIYKLMAATPYLREWIGARTAKEPQVHSLTVINKDFDSGIHFHRNDIRRDKTGHVAKAVQALGARTGFLPEDLLSTLLIANTATAYDGLVLYGDRTGVKTGGQTDNDLTSVVAAAGTIPTSAEMAAAIGGGVAAVLKSRDEEDAPMNQDAKRFAIMIPPDYITATAGAVGSEFHGTGQSNDLKQLGMVFDWFVNPWLASSAIFYMFRTDGANMGLIFQEEQSVLLETLLGDSDQGKKTGLYSWHASRIGNVAAGQPGVTIRHTFTT
jgi:hypothetical protein